MTQIVHFPSSAKCKKQDLRFKRRCNTLLAWTPSAESIHFSIYALHSLGYKRSKNIFFLELYLYIINFSSLVTCWAKILIQFEDSVKHNLVWFNLLLIPNVNLFRYWNSRKHTWHFDYTNMYTTKYSTTRTLLICKQAMFSIIISPRPSLFSITLLSIISIILSTTFWTEICVSPIVCH